jgi:hypothetical protein
MTTYIIDFIDTATVTEINQYLTDNGCTVIMIHTNLGNEYLVTAETMPPITDIVSAVIDDTNSPIQLLNVVPVTPAVHATTTLNVNDEKDWWKLYSAFDLNLATTTVNIEVHKSDNIVYILDSGIEVTHPEFVGKRIELLYSVIPGNFEDTSGHGTSIASVITGNTCSINDCVVKVVKIFDSSHTTLQSDLLAAFEAVAQDALANPNVFATLNLSWSIPRNVYIEQKIQLLIDKGVTVVAAAGNSGLPIQDVTPAAMASVVTVGAYNSNFVPCNFSDYTGSSATSVTLSSVNHGELDGWAPGERIWTAVLSGGYEYVAGTSIAAAIVSAATAYNSNGQVEGFNRGGLIRESKYTEFLTTGSFSKLGLLNLTDPKYVLSPNVIITFYNTTKKYQLIPMIGEFKTVVATGKTGFIEFFNAPTTVSYEALSTLPDWITIIGNTVVARPVDEPIDPSGVDVHVYSFRISSVGNITHDQEITVVVTASTFNPALLPEGDPNIYITTLWTACTTLCNPTQTCDALNHKCFYNTKNSICQCTG